MSDYFIGEIRLFAFGFAPQDWKVCDGSLLPVGQNQALYSLLGTQFGGNGTTTIGLPDLRGRTPVHINRSINDNSHILTGVVGSTGGTASVTLTSTQMPTHSHTVMASKADGSFARFAVASPTTAYPGIPAKVKALTGNPTANSVYAPTPAQSTGMAAMASGMVSPVGGAPHENRQPYLAATYCISTVGLYPPRT